MPPKTRVAYPFSINIGSWAVGWGYESETSQSIASRLNNVKLKIYDNSECNNVNVDFKKKPSRQICAGENNKNTCQGDTGGPLFVADFVNRTMSYVLVGITSYGNNCTNNPSIYTRVSFYLSWIEEFIYL